MGQPRDKERRKRTVISSGRNVGSTIWELQSTRGADGHIGLETGAKGVSEVFGVCSTVDRVLPAKACHQGSVG